MTSFASDNYAGAHPDVLAAVVAANEGHAPAYGHDAGTERAIAVVREALGSPTAEVAFVFNGTAANVLCLDALLRSHDAVVCAATAHVATDECGAPERLLGVKLLTVETADGKLTPAHVDAAAVGFGDEHRVQPRVVSISQSTELGTLYEPAEIAALAEAAHELGMQLHVDGARLANAAAALGCSLADLTTGCGVDAVSLGATKNGGLGAEAVVLLRPHARSPLPYRRKQSMQLASKMRYLAAQLEALTAATSGCATPRTRTRWPVGWPTPCRRARSRTRPRRTRSSSRCPMPPSRGCRRAGRSTCGTSRAAWYG